MLMAEAVKLAAIEALAPTAAHKGERSFPTLAGRRILDSIALAPADLDTDNPWTPVVTLHVVSSSKVSRGAAAVAWDMADNAIIEAVCELAISVHEDGETFTDAAAVADTDAEARLVLAALVEQVQRVLTLMPDGHSFRRLVKHVDKIDAEVHAVPQFGLRFHRIFLRFECQMMHEDIPEEGGFPPLLAVFVDSLPAESYAKARLQDLAARFEAVARTPLETITIAEGDPVAEVDESGSPIASVQTQEP